MTRYRDSFDNTALAFSDNSDPPVLGFLNRLSPAHDANRGDALVLTHGAGSNLPRAIIGGGGNCDRRGRIHRPAVRPAAKLKSTWFWRVGDYTSPKNLEKTYLFSTTKATMCMKKISTRQNDRQKYTFSAERRGFLKKFPLGPLAANVFSLSAAVWAPTCA